MIAVSSIFSGWINKCYEAYEDGTDYNTTVDKTAKIVADSLENKPDVDLDTLTDYDKMKDKLVMEVVSAETNKDLLETVPHKDIEDMAVVYRFVLNSDVEGRASILATNQMIENFGITADQLHADALENAPRIKPAEIKGMGEVLAEMMGIEQAEMMGLYPVRPEDEQIFVASVPDKVHGAGVLAYQDFMDQAAERAGGEALALSWTDKQMWGAVALSVIISFGAFLITFAAVAVGMALEGIGDKISEILAS